MAGPEGVVEKTVCNKAEAAGWIVRKVEWVGRRAAMDRLFLKGGRSVWIEFKRPDGEPPTTLQRREKQRFIDAGAEVHTVDNVFLGLFILGIE